ncbi:MAG TPA: sigma 54-interacting transcriptional regulator [Myxococcota bacterium]|jgi:two-component system response regulator HupR/HoxA|nr:sigma 54-interacting transcriptional regulator [Myxococcota bacterium]
MNTIDNSRFEGLHIVKMLRKTLSELWDLNFVFVDGLGNIVDNQHNRVTNAHNDVCRRALGHERGLGLCQQSVVDALAHVREARSEAPKLVLNACHLGFPIVVAPLLAGAEFIGAIVVGGFFLKDDAGASRRAVADGVRASGAGIPDLAAALRSVQQELDTRDKMFLFHLLEMTAKEVVEYVSAQSRHEEELKRLSGELGDRFSFGNLVGKAKPMRQMFALLDKVSSSDATVLVTGENGTGKELVARALHYNGPRADKAFVVQNVTALNDNLLESELFGHVRGSFTGATRDKKGLFEVADGGTFFLDEVGDMSPAMQVKMLRVLQEGTFLSVGATQPRQVDVRVIAATNRDLRRLVADGAFREDLFYRLNVINVHIPPLRERREDIPHLVDYFLRKHAEKAAGRGAASKRLAREVMARLYEHEWPGNVRELENEVERLCVLSGGDAVIGPELLALAQPGGAGGFAARHVKKGGTMDAAVGALEREMIAEALRREGGNRTRVARQLGVSRTTLIKKIKEFGLEGVGAEVN